MIKQIYILLAVLSFIINVTSLIAQQTIDSENLKSLDTLYPNDPAVFLNNSEELEFFFKQNRLFLKRKVQQSIYVKSIEGTEYARHALSLYNIAEDKEQFEIISIQSSKIENDTLSIQSLDEKNIIKKKINKEIIELSFEVPDVSPGSIIHIEYAIVSPFIYYLPAFSFQKIDPVISASHILIAPDFFEFSALTKGVIQPKNEIRDSIVNKKKCKIYSVKIDSIPPLQYDPYLLNIYDYCSSLEYEISAIYWPNKESEYLSINWDDVGFNYVFNNDIRNLLYKKNSQIKSLSKSLKNLDKAERVKAVYNYVQKNFTWNGETRLEPDQSLEEIFNSHTGHSGEINLLLVNILNRCKLKAKPVFLKTTDFGITFPNWPSKSEFNYVIAHLEVDGESMFLDATQPNLPPGNLPKVATNLTGLELEKKDSKVISIVNPNIYKSQLSLNINWDKKKSKFYSKGYLRINDYAHYYISDEIKNKAPNLYRIENWRMGTPLEVVYTRLSDSITSLGDKSDKVNIELKALTLSNPDILGDTLFFEADLGFGISEFLFEEKTRNKPVFLNHKSEIKNDFILHLPLDYSIYKLPSNTNFTTPNKSISLSYNIKSVDNKLVINYLLKVNSNILLPNEYADFKKCIDLICQKQLEKIVLIKKNK